jgi:hypothetical protein
VLLGGEFGRRKNPPQSRLRCAIAVLSGFVQNSGPTFERSNHSAVAHGIALR